MSDFEIIMVCFLIPGFCVLVYIAGRYNILELVGLMIQERTDELRKQQNEPDETVNRALDIAYRYSQIGGEHHKAWAIDQMVRALCGTEEKYQEWVAEYEKPLSDDPADCYEWDAGIAP